MAQSRNQKRSGTAKTTTADYRHAGAKRKNNPPAKIASEGRIPKVEKARYAYSPHLSPKLRFDPTGAPDTLPELLAEARQRTLSASEVAELNEALRQQQPWLEWTEKREQHERGFFEVDPVALHIHERVSAQAILRVAARQDVERSLFADPEQEYHEAVQFYKHDIDWSNRLILGDSLQVMSSLARRENLAGKVQMIYMDPPYGVNYRSNFQPEIGRRSVEELDRDLTREPEMVQAYRDAWHLGVHSYLSYLRDRLMASRELLTESGSIFVQISDQNVHLVRQILDEIFGASSFVSQIAFTKGGAGLETKYRPAARLDYILWYARDPSRRLFQQIYEEDRQHPKEKFPWIEFPSGFTRRLSADERGGQWKLPKGARLFADESLTKPGPGAKYTIEFNGQSFDSGRRWWGTKKEWLERALLADRIFVVGNTLRRKKFAEESAPKAINNLWDGLGGPSDPVYVVQTSAEVIRRCMLMTTRPGDLVLDPTCGGGTTAFVAEEWGRRWITIDTSRVAVSLARHRLLKADFRYFSLRDKAVGVAGGFRCPEVTNVTLADVANNPALDAILDKWKPILDTKLKAANDRLAELAATERRQLNSEANAQDSSEGESLALPANGASWTHSTLPFLSADHWPSALRVAIDAYRSDWRERRKNIDTCVRTNSAPMTLHDRPDTDPGVVRVSGPFTVEGVMPAELSLDREGRFGGAPADLESGEVGQPSPTSDLQNVHGYLTEMVGLIRNDGVTFLDNEHRAFSRVETLFDAGSWNAIHAEAAWKGDGEADGDATRATVAIGFGPQYGPVTAVQVEDLIREANRAGYDELIVAGFSFDPEATSTLLNPSHPKLRIHAAQIRPDVNPGMKGLLKQTPTNSQLFTVFGLPSIEVKPVEDDEWQVTLEGVDIYDPVKNEIRSTGATKVAAWFIDGDYDGRTFCTTQAFFPDQDAWEKLAKALGDVVEPEAFEAFKGTVSLPFPAGKHKRIAVKVIDPRGNEVMTTHELSSLI